MSETRLQMIEWDLIKIEGKLRNMSKLEDKIRELEKEIEYLSELVSRMDDKVYECETYIDSMRDSFVEAA